MTILEKLSVQLYSGRAFPPLDAQCATLEQLGIRKVEPYGALLADAENLAPVLRAHGLTAPSSHVGLNALQDDFDATVVAAKTLGISLLLVPAIPPEDRIKSSEGWRAFGAELNNLAGALAPHQIQLGWHNHDFEFVRTDDGQMPMDLILAGGPSLKWEMDIGWVQRAGEDPAVWLAKYRERIIALHVKDMAPDGENTDEDGWADIGYGEIDWHALLPAMQATGTNLFVLEHDKPSEFDRFVRRSAATVATW